jgi:hypothetical protein
MKKSADRIWVYMRLDRSKKEEIRRDHERERFYQAVRNCGFIPSAIIPSQKDSVHIAVYKNAETDSIKIFMVNKTQRQKTVTLQLSENFSRYKKASVWIDFDKHYSVDVNQSSITVPAFGTSAIVSF